MDFASLFDEHASALLRFFVRKTLNPEAAADLTAETFAAALESQATFRLGGSPSAWLYGIASHQLGRYWRAGRVESAARRRLGIPERSLAQDDYERIEDMIDLKEIGRNAVQALRGLPVDQRDAVVLRILDGLGYDEAAERLGCSAEVVRSRVSRGLRRLRTQIGDSDITTIA